MDIKRTTWSKLPVILAEAGQLAFPECKSPRTVPDSKWQKLCLAYQTWHHIFYSDGLNYTVPLERSRRAKYLFEIAQKIAKDEI
jgi:hypothetical protein